MKNKNQLLIFVLATFCGLIFFNEKVNAAPLVSGGNAVTSSSSTYYGYTEPYATISYNSVDAKGNRILLGYGKASKEGYFNFKLANHLRTGAYSWVYVTSNKEWNGGKKLLGRDISTGSSKVSDFSVYERVIDGGKYFDINDPSNIKNRSYLGKNAQFLRNKNIIPLNEQSKLPIKVRYPNPSNIITEKISARTKEPYPYGNLFTYSGTSLFQAVANGDTQKLPWQWNPISTSGAKTNNQNISFLSRLRSPQAEISLDWQGESYYFNSQQGVQLDSNGNVYIIYDNDDNFENTGSFVMRISAAYAYYLSQEKGNTEVEGKKTPIWLSKVELENALNSGNIAVSKILSSVHGATLSVVEDKAYVLITNDMKTQTLLRLDFSYALGEGPKNTGTTAKYTDTASRRNLSSINLGSSTFYKNDGKDLASGVREMPKNLTMVDDTTGYFSIPYSKSNGKQKGWYGYAFYQLKLENNNLVINQVPLIIQNMLGDAGDEVDPAQSITYNPNDGRMYITSNSVWASFDLTKYMQYGRLLEGKYEKVAYKTGPEENANPATNQIGPIDFDLISTKLNVSAETEQLAFFGEKTYLLVDTHNQLLISK